MKLLLYEIDTKPLGKLEGKVPNIQNVMNKTAGRVHGNLSEVAHFAKPRVTKLLRVVQDGERRGPSLHPLYSEHAMACFDLDCYVTIYFLAWLVEKLSAWYPAYVPDVDKELVGYIAQIAFDSGVFRVNENGRTAHGKDGGELQYS